MKPSATTIKRFVSPLAFLFLSVATHAKVPRFFLEEGSLKIENVGPDNPIIYDNDWWFDVFDNNYLWAQASLGKASLKGNIVSRDMWEWSKGYQYSFDQSWQDATKALKFARKSGLKKIPDLTAGSAHALQRPESGKIADTKARPTAGSKLIVAEAMKASPERPLLVIAGGPQTTVANALLTNPEIADRLIVFNLTVNGGYNGKDAWSAYIVAKKAFSIDWGGGEFWDKDSVFLAEHFKDLPKNPFTDDMNRLIRTNLGRANQLGDGAPLVWLYQHSCWTGAQVKKAEGHATHMRYLDLAKDTPGDVLIIPKSKTNLKASREEFFRVLNTPSLFP